MSDLISRQAAIDALHMHLMYRMGTDSNKKRLDDWINGVPSAQPERTCEYWDSESKFCALCRPSAQPRVSDCWGCKCQKMERLKEQKTFSEMVRLHDAKQRKKQLRRGTGGQRNEERD